jgi:hypothetical protein
MSEDTAGRLAAALAELEELRAENARLRGFIDLAMAQTLARREDVEAITAATVSWWSTNATIFRPLP